MTNPKVKSGRKSLTIDQQNDKAAVLAVLDSMRDDSDEAHPVRIVLEPKCSRVSPEELMGVLLAKTSIEENTSINLVMIGCDGKPQQKGLPQIVREWVSY